MEKVTQKQEITTFLQIDEYLSCYGDGSGYDDGFDDGFGSGNGFGDGSVDGDGYGYGNGNGSGNGYDDGSGYGFGNGNGDGSGDGDGYGYGNGSGHGDGDGNDIEYLNNQKIYTIDNIPTLIDSVHTNYAKGRILNSDLTTKPCFIAKCGNFFAHGETLRQAVSDAKSKYNQSLPVEDRVKAFNTQYPDRDKKIPAQELFQWHNTLTGSCLLGRKQFCEEHNLDYESGFYTVNEFISLTRDAYGGEVIRMLEQ